MCVLINPVSFRLKIVQPRVAFVSHNQVSSKGMVGSWGSRKTICQRLNYI